jgi:hypothetical protein
MNKAVYIDTGILPVPENELVAFSDYTGLLVSVEPVGPEYFIASVQDALHQLESNESSIELLVYKPEVEDDNGEPAHGG